jgi:transcriptional regulator with XRE-family HTH domain
MGRPSKYNSDFPLLAQGYARQGLSDEQIAENLGISAETLYQYVKKYPEFSEALKDGKAPVDIQVENALLRRALGYKFTERTIEYNANTSEGSPSVKSIKETKKEIPPDVLAIKFWLQNRRPKEWREVKDVNIAASFESKVRAMTAEELDAEYAKLKRGVEIDALTLDPDSSIKLIEDSQGSNDC